MLHLIHDRNVLTATMNGDGLFLGAASILDGLTPEQAYAKPHNLPHSIAEIVAHVCYWQEWSNRCAAVGFAAIPEHAVEGWPAVPLDGWDAARTRYLESVEEAKRIAVQSEALDEPLLPTGVQIPALSKESRGSCLLQAAVHNAHHLGQIITMRQSMGLWPPPGGTVTW